MNSRDMHIQLTDRQHINNTNKNDNTAVYYNFDEIHFSSD